MYMVKITEEKVESLAEHLEKGLRYIGKAMQCIDELKSNSKEHYGDRYDDEFDDERMGYRGGSMGNRGRYSRY